MPICTTFLTKELQDQITALRTAVKKEGLNILLVVQESKGRRCRTIISSESTKHTLDMLNALLEAWLKVGRTTVRVVVKEIAAVVRAHRG